MIIFAISERGQGEAAPYGRVATDRDPLQRELSSTVDSVNAVDLMKLQPSRFTVTDARSD
jgi:hypothetical protein